MTKAKKKTTASILKVRIKKTNVKNTTTKPGVKVNVKEYKTSCNVR